MKATRIGIRQAEETMGELITQRSAAFLKRHPLTLERPSTALQLKMALKDKMFHAALIARAKEAYGSVYIDDAILRKASAVGLYCARYKAEEERQKMAAEKYNEVPRREMSTIVAKCKILNWSGERLMAEVDGFVKRWSPK